MPSTAQITRRHIRPALLRADSQTLRVILCIEESVTLVPLLNAMFLSLLHEEAKHSPARRIHVVYRFSSIGHTRPTLPRVFKPRTPAAQRSIRVIGGRFAIDCTAQDFGTLSKDRYIMVAANQVILLDIFRSLCYAPRFQELKHRLYTRYPCQLRNFLSHRQRRCLRPVFNQTVEHRNMLSHDGVANWR
jgi:hypothetical protein